MFKKLKQKFFGQGLEKKQEIREKSFENMNSNYQMFQLTEDNSKGFGVLGGATGGATIDDNISSNLAFDKYQGLLAYGTKSGDIKMFSLKGYEQEIYGAHEGCPILHILFVPG